MSAVQKACHRPVFGHFFILVSKAYYYQHVTLCGNGIESQNQVDTPNLLGRWGSLTLVGSSSRGRKKPDFKPLPYRHTQSQERLWEYTLRRNPELESLRQFIADFTADFLNVSILLATPAMVLVPHCMGSCLPLDYMSDVGGGGGRPAVWATACLPYHPCPGLNPWETFQGADPWPLVTNVCHTHRTESLWKRDLKSYTIGQEPEGTRPWWNQSCGN